MFRFFSNILYPAVFFGTVYYLAVAPIPTSRYTQPAYNENNLNFRLVGVLQKLDTFEKY